MTFSLVALTVGCNSHLDSTSVSATNTASSTVVTAQEPTITPFVGPESGPTPSIEGSVIETLVFGGDTADCHLPCWNNLQVGVTSRNDVQAVLDTKFDTKGQVFPLPPFISEPPSRYQQLGHYWYLETKPQGSLLFRTVLANDTGKLEEMSFVFGTSLTGIFPDTFPQNVIRKLGKPNQWLISKNTGGQGDGFHLTLTSLIIYDGGINFAYQGELPAPLQRDAGGVVYAESAQFCLGKEWGWNFNSTVNIGVPLKDGFNNLTPLQETEYAIREGLKPIDEVLNISLDEIVNRSQQEENPCWTIDVPVP